ncbi:MAG: hypothetical protein SOX56_08265 [[Pasteurella] mairii]|uniref:Uncharacterized protein n=1 Tax=[Pasteurella] mairii TaxID=757 RepID=A0A379B570_9PAST|nr:hypothetical protein [[Pasteurella] mairii]SUB33775.1 Uncharacterised protein [[Pasteurella] mairii]
MSFDFFHVFHLDNIGKSISLKQIGLENKVRPLIKKNGAFGRSAEDSIESRFIAQFVAGERVTFSNVYNFGKEANGIVDPLWAIGSAKIEGKINNVKFFPGNFATADITYELYDKFTDPYDTFNWVKGEWNTNGTPYEIKDRWTNTVKFNYRPQTEEQLLQLLKQR